MSRLLTSSPYRGGLEMAAVALFLFAASAASADDVVSAGPDKVAVTIYRDGPVATAGLAASDNGLALITETRIVDVPAGRSRVLFEGVADGIVPQSAAIEGLPAGVVERNFDYDLLDPASMLARSVGETVSLRRVDAKTGRVSEERAIVRSGRTERCWKPITATKRCTAAAGPRAWCSITCRRDWRRAPPSPRSPMRRPPGATPSPSPTSACV